MAEWRQERRAGDRMGGGTALLQCSVADCSLHDCLGSRLVLSLVEAAVVLRRSLACTGRRSSFRHLRLPGCIPVTLAVVVLCYLLKGLYLRFIDIS